MSLKMNTPIDKRENDHDYLGQILEISNVKSKRSKKMLLLKKEKKMKRQQNDVTIPKKRLSYEDEKPSTTLTTVGGKEEEEEEEEKELIDIYRNLCTNCNIDMGIMNPRQLCGKTYCMFQDIL